MAKSIKSALSNLKAGVALLGEAVNDIAIMIDGNGTSLTRPVSVGRRRGYPSGHKSGNRLLGAKRVKALSLLRKLKAWRITNKLSQAQMAEKVGFTETQATAWGHWEKGRACPTAFHFATIAEFAARENVS